MTQTTSAAGIAWNLSDLFADYNDPAITSVLDEAAAEAKAFAQTYRGTINVPGGPDAEHLRAGLEEFESLQDKMSRPAVYATLLFSADTSKPEHRNLQQHVEQRLTSTQNELLFFSLEWLELSDADADKLSDHPVLESYHHYLTNARRYQPHKLSEAEERIVNEKDVTGVSAWQRLYAEITSGLSFPMEIDGVQQQLTLDAVLSLMYDSDRAVRQQAFTKLFEVLGDHAQTLAYIYNTLVQDKLTMDRLRIYPDPMAQRNLDNEIEPDVVKTMLEVVEQNYTLAQRYFTLKAKLLDLPRLQIYDQYAPIGEVSIKMSYEEAQTVILEAFTAFDPSFRETANLFFERNWIDAEIRPGKRGGAFCMPYPPSLHPYILCNYTDKLRDVMTVAHELGHGIHFWMARKQSLLNFSPTLPLAETASVFGEMLTFEHLLEHEQDRGNKLALVCGKIEDIFATVFRQNILTRFEQDVFAARAANRLTPEQLGQHWIAANQRYYGDAVETTGGYELGWSYIPHFINSPFYCYSYVFGELLVLALYGMYREQGQAFVPRYLSLLEAGGSQAPSAALAELGVDLHDPGFWQLGFQELQRLIEWAEELAA
jgi:oligoendopeptidase F